MEHTQRLNDGPGATALFRRALNRSAETLKRVGGLARQTVAATALIGLMVGGQASAQTATRNRKR